MIISHRHKFAFFRVPKTGSSTAMIMLRICGVFNDEDYATPVAGLPNTLPEAVVEKHRTNTRNLILQQRQQKANGAPVAEDEESLNLYVDASMSSYLAHLTPQQALDDNLITMEQLREYRCYAYLRDPLDRQVSAYAHMLGSWALPEMFKQSVKDGKINFGLLNRPQADYFYVDGEQVVEPLNFKDYANELRRMISLVGGYHFERIPKLNNSAGRPKDTTLEDYYTPALKRKIREHFAVDTELFKQIGSK